MDAETRQRLLELVYDLLPEDEAAELRGRIEADAEMAAAYREAQETARLLAEAARLPSGGIPAIQFAKASDQEKAGEFAGRARIAAAVGQSGTRPREIVRAGRQLDGGIGGGGVGADLGRRIFLPPRKAGGHRRRTSSPGRDRPLDDPSRRCHGIPGEHHRHQRPAAAGQGRGDAASTPTANGSRRSRRPPTSTAACGSPFPPI